MVIKKELHVDGHKYLLSKSFFEIIEALEQIVRLLEVFESHDLGKMLVDCVQDVIEVFC
jgi:hypothetical protein